MNNKWNMVVVFRNSDSERKTIAYKYRLKELLNAGYEIIRTDSADGVLTYILQK